MRIEILKLVEKKVENFCQIIAKARIEKSPLNGHAQAIFFYLALVLGMIFVSG